MALLRELIQPASLERCGDRSFPVLSMTMHDGIMLQSDRFKKSLASVDQSAYKVVRRNQLVVGFPIDEGVLYIQQVADAGIMSPAYDVWNVDETKVNLQYFELCLHSPQSMMFYKTNLRGTTARRRSLPKETLLSLPVPVPSMERQLEIASSIGRLKELIALRQRQLGVFDTLIKTRFIEMFEGKYNSVTLGDVVKTTSGGTPSKAHPEYYSGGSIPWLTSGEINAGVITAVKNYITEEGLKNSSAKMIPENSVVIAMYGATAGVTGILRLNTTTNQAVCSLLPNERYIPEYLYYAVASKKEWMISQCQGGGQPNISQGIIKSMKLIDAPINEQKQFAAFVAQVDKSKVAVQKALDEAQLLFDSLMQQYFG